MLNKVALFFVIGCSWFVGFEASRLVYAPRSMDLVGWAVLVINIIGVLVSILNLPRSVGKAG